MSKIVKTVRRCGKKIASKVRALVERCRRQGNRKSSQVPESVQPAYQSVQPADTKSEPVLVPVSSPIYTIDRPLPFKAVILDIGRLYLERLFADAPQKQHIYEDLYLDVLFEDTDTMISYPDLSLDLLFTKVEEEESDENCASYSCSTDSILSNLMDIPRVHYFQLGFLESTGSSAMLGSLSHSASYDSISVLS